METNKPNIKSSEWFEQNGNLPGREAMPPKKRSRPKVPLSQTQTPIKVSEWFANNKGLPTGNEEPEVIVEPVEKKKRKSKNEEAEDIQPIVNVSIKPVPNSVDLGAKQAAIDYAKLDKGQKEEMEDLIASILKLTTTIQQERIERIKAEEDTPEEDKKQNAKNIRELITSVSKDKIAQVKSKLTLRNLLFSGGLT